MMRYVIHKHVVELVRSRLGIDMALFREIVGVSFKDLHGAKSRDSNGMRLLSNAQAYAIDQQIGQCVSFAPPASKMLLHLGKRQFDQRRIGAFIERTGVTVTALANLLGRSPAWIHLHLRRAVPMLVSEENEGILDALCSSNESPSYEEIKEVASVAPSKPSEAVTDAIDSYCFASVITTTSDKSHVPKWRKILQTLVRLSDGGLKQVDENKLVVEVWRAFPAEFGLRGYESQYPEAREIRSKLVTSPLSKYVERGGAMPAAWISNTAGSTLVNMPRSRESRRYADALMKRGSTCRAAGDRRCTGSDDPQLVARLPLGTKTEGRRPVFAPFINAARKMSAP
jgi:hypothetical protein